MTCKTIEAASDIFTLGSTSIHSLPPPPLVIESTHLFISSQLLQL